MPLLTVGVGHQEAQPSQLQELTDAKHQLIDYLAQHSGDQVNGFVLLATCNRFEAYLDAATFHGGVGIVMDAVKAVLPDLSTSVTEAFYSHVGQGAVEHLFRVTAGLESMVIGEAEISGQVRLTLTGSHHISPPLRRAFQAALSTSKAITTQTHLRGVGRSLASVGLDLAGAVEQPDGQGCLLPDWPNTRVLIIGTGQYAGTVVAELTRRGCRQLRVYSGSGNATHFATTHPVTPVASLPNALADTDLLVTASGKGLDRISADMLTPGLAQVFVDLTGGADLDDDLPVRVIGLAEIGEHSPTANQAALDQAEQMVADGVAALLQDEAGNGAAPAIIAMRGYVEDIIATEAARARSAYPPDVAAAVEKALHRVTGALLHHPSVAAAELARIGRMAEYNQALETLFGILVEPQ